ncbi:DNA methyltransferase [Halalkalibaculum sp. DA3122]|uniref:DNA methyltransferase n=1 Tax=Halalkalibaculum sp. DA3122 TaxID=3373607 RepID=UPI003754497A
MRERAEQRFYSKLKDTFVGEEIKGESGYVNLMNLRQQYFDKIEPFIKESVEEKIENDAAKEELYDKLYTFFDAYLNETGTVFFADTQLHKNLYERVYSDRDDVSLFWKTQKLYYVKSEALYDDLETEIDGITFRFDASAIKHSKGNEKKQLEFYLAGIEDSKLTFKPKYQEQNSYDHFRKHFDEDDSSADVKNFIYDNYPDIVHPNVKVVTNDLDHTIYSKTDFKQIISVYDINDAVQTAGVEFAPYKVEHILKYIKEKEIPISEDQLRKAFRIYKKQNEVDYFIHKDAKGFLTEQFNIYLYNYLFDDKDTEFTEKRVKQIQTIKEIAAEVIDYIACFEDELKSIWNKPKFVRNSNYVFTLDRISDNAELIEKIVEHPGFEKQIEEYKNLHEEWTDEEGNTTKKVWKEFEWASDFSPEDILITEEGSKKLNPDFKHLPVDTKYFADLKWDILDDFDHLEDQTDGFLIKSDNYQALNTLLTKFQEGIDLIYIDPPFNTGDDFLYKDKFQDSTWLTLMENRMALSYELLNTKGSHYLHLDENANYLGRILSDRIFGSKNFQREIIWDIQVLSGYKVKVAETNWILGHQSILFHTKSDSYKFNKQVQPHTLKYLRSFNKTDEDGRDYQVAHGRRIYKDEVKDKGKPFGDVWPQLKDIIDVERPFPDVWEELTAAVNFDRPQEDVWGDIMSFQQQPTSSERILFDTQKPEELLSRIIKSGTDTGDWVLDYFAGSGTTAATALKINRKFITCEMGEHFDSTLLPRIKRTLLGHETSVSREESYHGGGFIKYYQLEQYEDALSRSAYQEQDNYDISKYAFGADQKQLEAIELDYENEKAHINFEKLYPDVDIAETLSNLTGKKIRKLNAERVEFEDGQEIVFDEMTFGEYPWIKPLIWWNSRRTKQN